MSYKMKKIGISDTSCKVFFNREIELNQKMLILKRFVTKSVFLCDDDN